MQLLVTGAEQGEAGSVGVVAVLEILDLAQGKTVHRFEYKTTPELWNDGQKIQFTGFSIMDDALYVCTHNEILIFRDWPPESPSGKITLKQFNDLHHCHPWNGGLAIANTGLETVDVVSLDGQLEARWDLLGNEPIPRRKPRSICNECDYRLMPDTKPHYRHANHLFVVNDELWSTQLSTSDAICLDDPRKRISMDVGMPHDGTVFDDEIVFTTTNGNLVLVDESNTEEKRIVDLNEVDSRYNQLGWCRGVWKIDDRRYLVGFSTIRRSKWKDFGYFLKHGHDYPPSRITLFDVDAGSVEDEWLIGEKFGFQLFQFEALPESRWIRSE